MITPTGRGGAAGDVDAVTAGLDAELTSERTRRKVRKLIASGLGERHPYLHVDGSGAPFAGFYAMAFTEAFPKTRLRWAS